jgi:hypothetical protein
MRDYSLMPNFKILVPTDSHLTHKTIMNYFKNSLRLQTRSQVELRGIRTPTDIFKSVPVVGRLKDFKFQLILFKVDPDPVSNDESSSDEDFEPCSSDIEGSVIKSLSHTETEKSYEQ